MAAKQFASGLIPGFQTAITVYEKLSGNKQCSDDRQPTQEQLEKLIAALHKTDDCMKNFVDKYPSWLEERQECIQEVKQLADNIDFHHRNINVAQLPTSAVSVVGGILMITGTLLIPVTFGVSLGLTITGAVMGVGATATGMITAGTDIGIRMDRLNKAKKCIYQHKESTQEIEKITRELYDSCAEVTKIADDEVMADFLAKHIGKVGQMTIVDTISAVSIGYAVIKTIPKAAKSLHLLRKGFGTTAAATASSLRVVEAANGSVKVAATTAGKVFSGIGIAFGAVGIIFDIVSAGMSIYDLASGSETYTARKLREEAKNLEEEMELATKIHTELKNKLT